MLDSKKAFDSVTHEILLQKLDHYGIRGKAFNSFSSYLSNRQQYFSMHNINSSTLPIKYGVPQGSVLGPLLFLLYINHLTNSINTTPRHFADDTWIIANALYPAVLEQTLSLEVAGLSMPINLLLTTTKKQCPSWPTGREVMTTSSCAVIASDPTRGSRHDFPSGRPGRTLLFSCLLFTLAT